MTLASVVIGPAMRRPWRDLDVGVVVDVAVEHGRPCTGAPPLCSSSSLFSGWQLASLMMPTLAQRVCPSTDRRAVGLRQREAQQRVVGDRGAQRARVVAELADLRGRLVDEAEAPPATRTEPFWNSGSLLRSNEQRCTAGSDDDRGRGSRRTGAGRPSRGRAPPAGRAPTAPAGSRGSRRPPPPAVAAGERLDRRAPVRSRSLPDRPGGVAQLDQLGAAIRSMLIRVERLVRLEPRSTLGGAGLELVEPGGDRRRPARDGRSSAATPGTPFSSVIAAAVAAAAVRAAPSVGDRLRRGRRASRRFGGTCRSGRPAEDGDDATHDFPGYRAAGVPIGRPMPRTLRCRRQPKRDSTRAARPSAVGLSQRWSAASTITRISGSVPLARTRTRPSPSSDCLGGGDLVGQLGGDRRMPLGHPHVDQHLG